MLKIINEIGNYLIEKMVRFSVVRLIEGKVRMKGCE